MTIYAEAHCAEYAGRLAMVMHGVDWEPVARLGRELRDCWKTDRQVFLAGNGGSAANAIHLANDFLYAVSQRRGSGLRVHALPANAATLTCLANDEGYEHVFSAQLAVLARPGDVFIALSGSGNSQNVALALVEARRIGMASYAIVGFDGGAAKQLADVAIHVAVNDMQIAEDAQLILGHMLMQWVGQQMEAP